MPRLKSARVAGRHDVSKLHRAELVTGRGVLLVLCSSASMGQQ